MDLTFIKGDKHGSETDYRDALPVNMVAIAKPVLGAQGYMLQEAGLTYYVTDEDSQSFLGADRGGIYVDRVDIRGHYRVSGESLIQVNSDGTVTRLGEITGSDNAKMAASFSNVAIVADNKLYMYNSTDGLRQITDEDLGDTLVDITWVDNYFFLTDGDRPFHSSITDETTFEPLDFGSAEFKPDSDKGVGHTTDNYAVVFGRESTQYFVNDGTDDFSFRALTGRNSDIGIVCATAKAYINNSFYVIGSKYGESLGFYQITAGGGAQLSTREIEKILSQYNDDDLSSAIVEYQKFDGYQFAIFHLPNETIKLNITIAQQAGLSNAYSIMKTGTQSENYPAVNGVFDLAVGKWIYGDKADGRIGYLDNTTGLHYGELAEWLLYTPFYMLDGQSVRELKIKTVSGFTSTNDATVALSVSYDGVDQTAERWIDYGVMGEYDKQFIARRLGRVRDFISFRMRGASYSRMAFSRGVLEYG